MSGLNSRVERFLNHAQGVDISTVFPGQVSKQAERILTGGIRDTVIKRKNVDGITIDGPTSLDLDDGIWAEKTSTGYRLYVHISDVSEAIPVYSPIDFEAMKRTTSIYRRDGVIPMIPEVLSNDLLSLNGSRRHITLTVEIDIDHEGVIQKSKIYESLFTNMNRYTHEEFDLDIQSPESKKRKELLLLAQVANLLRFQRQKRGGILDTYSHSRHMNLGESENDMAQSKSNIPSGYIDSHKIIEAFMVLANECVAQKLSGSQSAIFRVNNELGEAAFYSADLGGHNALKSTCYTHFTSPIRRFADLIAHRIIKSQLKGLPVPYERIIISGITNHLNYTRFRVETLSRIFHDPGVEAIERIKVRNGGEAEVYHLCSHIRRSSYDKGYTLPDSMRKFIQNKMSTDQNIANWAWAVGVILLGKDQKLKETLYEQIVIKKRISASRFLNILAETRLMRGLPVIFEQKTTINPNMIALELDYLGANSKTFSRMIDNPSQQTLNYAVATLRYNLMLDVFEYFMNQK